MMATLAMLVMILHHAECAMLVLCAMLCVMRVVCSGCCAVCAMQCVLCGIHVLYGVCYVHGSARAMYIGYYDVCIINSYPQVRKSEKDPRKSKPMCLAAAAAAC